MSADLDGGAAPASLDDLIVAEPLEAADNGGAAPDAAPDTDAAVAEETSHTAEDAGPAPEAE
ncbi:hypothetical protein SAMN04488074_101452 [Lentzea albidocapillata subsp. violacea]|uniref:Uncharacterized protein n=1 Tax=Lentzea albidocapillata subsp. violacea TaxID=128104 RepID=A0A1G8QTD6_9PSEU|nr:hypothetical protein [Lentzea albidocapillata]SDJ07966.1 hypothetical protein SAMN04488074_101452 [Lentzea albidocapillata subsp. violacea]